MRALILPVLAVLLAACASPVGPRVPNPTVPTQAVDDQSLETNKDASSSTAAMPEPMATSQPPVAPLPMEPKAPAINNTVWLNTEPLTQNQLNGKVVLIDFWTFGCINCLNTIPAVRELYYRYKDQGLIVIGVHSPEFQYEHDVNNVKDAIKRLDVPYPVALDNDFATWNAFHNRYWPALYLIDKRGVIRSNHIGELHENTPDWTEFTALIDTLLKE